MNGCVDPLIVCAAVVAIVLVLALAAGRWGGPR